MQPLESLRQLMQKKGVDAVIIPGTDPHQSEYLSDHWKFRHYLTGFTGSNGTAVVTLDKAALWTDSRYFLQADRQLDGSGFELMRENGDNPSPTREDWLAENLDDDALIAIDGLLFSTVAANRLERFCGEYGFRMATDFHPDSIWTDRPALPAAPAYAYDETLAGETVDSKLSRLLTIVERNDAEAMLIAGLDEIAWLFNMRGSDIEHTPVAIAYAFIADDDYNLFIDKHKITPELAAHLKRYGIRTRDYDDIERYLERRSSVETVMLDPQRVSDTLANALPGAKVYAASPIDNLKAVKNEAEIEGTRRAMERDGAALVRLHRWIEQNAASGTVTEVDLATRAAQERAKGENYTDESFDMIAGYNEHGAIVHYEATPDTDIPLQPKGFLLLDSGAQYSDGTTDITRTIALGPITEEQKRIYTLVLKGHIQIELCKFPSGSSGTQIDILARKDMWREGLNYLHGTGHGVGTYLNVHEGPHQFRMEWKPAPLVAGMTITDEPGIYLPGRFGVRIENTLLIKPYLETEFGRFLQFESLTLCPIDTAPIVRDMLLPEEVEWLNAYHETVYEQLAPHLVEEERRWLEKACEKI